MEKIINKKTIYKGRIVELQLREVQLSNGKIANREVILHQPGVSIIAHDNESVFLVKQFRSGIEKEILEIPAGLVDFNEDPVNAASRELQEEIGYNAKSFELLTKFYPSPGFCDEVTHIYLASDLYESKLQADEDEFINVIKLPIKDIEDFINTNEFVDAKTALGLSLFLLNRKKDNN